MVTKKFLGVFVCMFLVGVLSFGVVSSLEFNGTVYDENGNALNNSLINVTIRDNSFQIVGYNSTNTNESGWFNLTLSESPGWMYQPVITYTNSTLGHVQYVGQSLPAFPGIMIQEISGTKFYLREAGTINITAVNDTGSPVQFQYQIKDTKLGYAVSEDFENFVSQKTVYVQKDRNYSIMIFPNASMPVSFEWNNFSSSSSYDLPDGLSDYNVTTKNLNKQFNISMSHVRLHGYINASSFGVSGWDNFTIVGYMLEPGDMVHSSFGTIPYNLSAFFETNGTDVYNTSTGFYNISLPSTAESSDMMLFATGMNDSVAYGSLMNVSFNSGTYSEGENVERNFTMYQLLGDAATISLENLGGEGQSNHNVTTAMYSFGIVNSSNVSLTGASAHSEVSVDYSPVIGGLRSFTWMTDSDQGGSASLQVPLLNISSVGIDEMNVFVSGGNYAPKRTSYTNSDLQSGATNITISSFKPGEIDEGNDISSNLKIAMFKSNSTCDVPSPGESCVIGSSDSSEGESFGDFNPISAVMGGGKISFRMGLLSSGIIVHYVNVDMLASGPPDALFDDSSTESTSGSFAGAMRFGGNGPTIYDYVLISMPYTEGSSSQTGLNESGQVNLSIPFLYDEDWNVIWDTSDNGTSGSNLASNYSHYSEYSSEWETLMSNNTCTTNVSGFNSTSPCYIDKTDNRIWVRLPHFSGAQPSVTGGVVTASSTDSSSSDSSSSSGGSGAGTFRPSRNALENGYSVNVIEGTKVEVTFGDVGSENKEMVLVKEVDSESDKVTISFGDKDYIIDKNYSAKIDLDGDGFYDVEVLNKENYGQASSLEFKLISEEVPSDVQDEQGEGVEVSDSDESSDEESEEVSGRNNWYWYVLGIVVLAFVVWFIVKKFGKVKK